MAGCTPLFLVKEVGGGDGVLLLPSPLVDGDGRDHGLELPGLAGMQGQCSGLVFDKTT